MARRLAAVCAIALGLVLATGPRAGAHALLAGSEPASGAQVERAPTLILLTFTEPVDASLTTVHVLDSDGDTVERGRARSVTGQSNAVSVDVGDLDKGSYTVAWRTTSSVDGHTTGGAFAFGVQVPAAGVTDAQTQTTPSPSGLGVAGRAGYYAGLLALVGAAVIRVSQARRMRLAAWAIAFAGALAMGADLLQTTDAGLARLASTTTGTKYFLELAAVGLTGVAVAMSRRVAPVVVAAALGLLARAWAGHAAATSPVGLTVATQWVHMLAVGVWIGALPWLVVALRRGAETRTTVRRFSNIATVAVIVVVTTGVVRSLTEVGSWDGLDTDFGRTLLVKLGLVAAVLALATFNRFKARERTVAGEAAIAACVLGTTALLAGWAPAATVIDNRPTAISIEGSDFATTVLVRIEVTPGTAGPNRFAVEVVDYDSHEPVRPRRVSLRLAPRDRPEVPVTTVPLTRSGDRWVADSAAISITGRWAITAIVETDRGGTEVPLELRTRQPQQRITAQRSPGLPTIYTITVGAQRLEAYVDPGSPGRNEVHFTFYDAAGGEAETELVEVTARGRRLENRRLGPGHFVADVELSPGKWRFTARTVAGLDVYFDETID